MTERRNARIEIAVRPAANAASMARLSAAIPVVPLTPQTW
jgi:hypothetical protein